MKAFPAYEYQKAYDQMMAVGGMDLRDYFAAKAMQGLVGNGAYDQSNLTGLVNYAYLLADFMLEKREQKQ